MALKSVHFLLVCMFAYDYSNRLIDNYFIRIIKKKQINVLNKIINFYKRSHLTCYNMQLYNTLCNALMNLPALESFDSNYNYSEIVNYSIHSTHAQCATLQHALYSISFLLFRYFN